MPALNICTLSRWALAASMAIAQCTFAQRLSSPPTEFRDVDRQLLSLRDTIAGRQFEAFRDIREARQMGLADDVAVRAVLSRAELPESQLSPEALEAGCREHLRKQWTIVWNARAEAARQTSPGALAASLSAASGWRTRLDAEAAEVGLSFEALFPDGLDVAPAPIDPPPASASVEDMKVYLLRALLNPPTPQSNARDIVAWAAKVADAVKSTPLGPRLMQAALPWSHVLQAPDHEVLEAAVEFAAGPAGQAHAGDLLRAAFGPGVRRPALDEALLLKLLLAAPQETVVDALSRESSVRGAARPMPPEWVFDPRIPPAIRQSLAGVFADDPQFLVTMFRNAEDRKLDPVRGQVLDAYINGRVRFAPDLAPLAPVVRSSEYPPSLREKALEAICARAEREQAADLAGRASALVQALAGDLQDPGLRGKAESALRGIETRTATRQAERLAAQAPEDERERVRKDTREWFARLDAALQDPSTTPESKVELIRFQSKLRNDHAMFGLKQVYRQLLAFAAGHDGMLPETLAAATTAPEIRECAIVYVAPPGAKLENLGEKVILAVSTTPIDPLYGEDSIRIVLLLANGDTPFPSAHTFREYWARSNAARQAMGLPPAPPDLLGPVAAWLQPATRPKR